MNLLHVVLGGAVVLLNGVGGVQALVRGAGEVPGMASWGHGALGVQLASGFFLLTGTTGGPGVAHVALPFGALAMVLGVRVLEGPARLRAIGAASLLAAGLSAVVFTLGYLDA